MHVLCSLTFFGVYIYKWRIAENWTRTNLKAFLICFFFSLQTMIASFGAITSRIKPEFFGTVYYVCSLNATYFCISI